MTDAEQRQQAFVDAVNAASARYGFTITADLQAERLGAVLQTRPMLTITPVPGWQPPDNGNGADNSAPAEISTTPNSIVNKKE